MNFKKIYVLLCALTVCLVTLAAQPGGKYYGNHNRKLSKKDLRVGPCREAQRKQAAWEQLQTKKAQKLQEPKAACTAPVDVLQQFPLNIFRTNE